MLSIQRKEYSNAKKRYKVDTATYECAECGIYCYEGKSEKNLTALEEKYKMKTIVWEKVHMDHIDPVDDPITGFQDWNIFFSNLFCDEDKLQALCKECHNLKTKKETDIRSERKRNSRGTTRTPAKSKRRKKDS
jgi:hypothetical protein